MGIVSGHDRDPSPARAEESPKTASVHYARGSANTSGRALAGVTAALLLAGACSSGSNDAAKPSNSSSPSAEVLSPGLRKVIDSPDYKGGKWALLVVDTKSGKTIYQLNTQTPMASASTTKLNSVSAGLDGLGADHRFRTPVLRSGEVSPSGDLAGNLIMVGQGDLTLGGRTKPDGSIDVENFDHTDANAIVGFATLTPEDPLAGLNQMATQVASSGVKRVKGDVLLDERLWDPVTIGDVPITPISVNDNLIDLMITPGAPGAAATVTSRPETAAFRVEAQVTTTPAGTAPDITTDDAESGVVKVTGTVNADAKAPLVHVYQVPDPAAFARTLFIEALQRAGVSVDAQPLGPNPAPQLPPSADVARLPKVGELESPAFSETAKLINKVSHNLGAAMIPLLLAVKNGQRTNQAGMEIVSSFVQKAGADPTQVHLVDGEGTPENRISADAQVKVLRYLVDRPYFKAFFDSTPVIGVDGSLKNVVPPDDPAVGHVSAKTGTNVGGDANGNITQLKSKALAGYVDTKGGKRLAFALYVNDVPITSQEQILKANNDLGAMASSIYSDQ